MSSGANYEFDEAQNETIGTLAKTLTFVGVVTLAFALLFGARVALSIGQAEWSEVVSLGMTMIFTLSLGSLTFNSGRAFQAIVNTSGQDISHLMDALDKLRQTYSILTVIIIICMFLTVAAILISLMSFGPAVV